MGYYYTVQEYASIKGLHLSIQDEMEAAANATMLSNKHGIPINKTCCNNSGSKTSCYAVRILRETFRSSAKTIKAPSEKLIARVSG
ncbi:hypothetical protein GCM10027443_31380 [Pontibacter brevis]